MPDGLTIHEGWLSPGWELWLLKQIEREQFAIGSTVDHVAYPSRVSRYGVRTYGNAVMSAQLPRWADVLATIHPRVAFNHITINYYSPGDGIAPHIDRPDCGDVIHVLSLGSDAIMAFDQSGGDVHHVALPARSMLTLTGDARWLWRHSIPPVSSARVSIVLRNAQPIPVGT